MPGKLEMGKHFLKERDIPGVVAFCHRKRFRGITERAAKKRGSDDNGAPGLASSILNQYLWVQ